MKSTPILFSGPMVRAILEGRKTQTRRIIKPQPSCDQVNECIFRCPYGAPGDRLWVRETWARELWSAGMDISSRLFYAADGHENIPIRWRPSIHMRRSDSRITLEIVSVRVERLNDITHWDAKAEGVECLPNYTAAPVDDFRELWDSINGRGSWDSNPWVWRIEFKKL